ncbi:DUF2326 domain-containing protein [Priestia megaterium]|uniref:DUF2326 domain-containing protein n=1 Tax=Priestia megaterium TaxID=1404 RepID=UPI00177C0931|nr:DUF2326 domain-containing protein [Priestia megaterium]MBD8115013.1 DUF2326 domain-containing protein [Priestia megaterium]
MRLVKLSSNMDSFHSIEFKDGLNLIVGQQANPNNSDKRNTYNGVGKSLTIYLIHFCLGSNNIKALEEKIPGWEFRLDIEIDGERYFVNRNTSKQSEIYLNNKKHTLPSFRKELLAKVFNIKSPVKNLSFNTLFPRFIRRDRECYAQYDNFIKKEQDYSKLLNNAFLLGLDIGLIENKKKVRDEYKSTDDLAKRLAKDSTFKQHFENKEDAEIEILDLQEEIKKLEYEVENFKISENYHEMEKKADEAKFQKKRLENKRVLINNSIRNIEKSLTIKPDISAQKVIELYRNAEVEIPKMIVKRVEETVNFHEELLASRKNRLYKELNKNKSQLSELDKQIINIGNEIDKLIRYLDTHKAIDEYVSLNNKLHDLKVQHERLLEYQEILKNYKKKTRTLQTDFTSQTQTTEEYLEGINGLLENIMNTFRELSKEFYDKPGGIKIENNEGENTLRYNITAKIQDDSSDGVNEVKIFCFDMTLLLLQQNHNVKFLFHDSRLFSNMDPRQRYTLFKLAFNKTAEHNYQYIASVNEDTLLSFKDLMSEEEYEQIIEDNIILKLTDESEKSKLLGVQIDMDYEK